MLILSSIIPLAALAGSALGRPTLQGTLDRRDGQAPVVGLDYGTFQGSIVNSTDSFLGIPFAQPPTGNLRFRLPQTPANASGTYNTTFFRDACPRQAVFAPNATIPNVPPLNVSSIGGQLAPSLVNASEDCLYLNVVRPANMSENEKLPVLIWIYGGAYADGDASVFNGVPVVQRSVALDQPVIFVSFNYRLNGFGFLPGKEVKEAGIGNLGLQDQRFAMQWVQKYISQFGGDPTKVIIWGESAGSNSIVSQMAAGDGQNSEGLFRGAVLESGYPGPMNDITEGQPIYDQLVAATNCSSPSNSSSTLDCLRSAPYELLMNAINNTPPFMSYTSANLTWQPRTDGVFLKRTLRQAFETGLYTKVPVIAGDCDDEGTVFSLFSTNVTTNQGFLDYVHTVYMTQANDSQIAAVGQAYPEDPSQGSPYGTGNNNTVTPEFKRIASFQGDWMFQAPRRLMLRALSQTQDTWGFLYKRDKSTPDLGSYHSSDIKEFFAIGAEPDYVGTDALVNFAYRLNPNAPTNGTAQSGLANITWPQWNTSTTAPPLLTFEDPSNLTITYDNYRSQAMELLNELQAELSL